MAASASSRCFTLTFDDPADALERGARRAGHPDPRHDDRTASIRLKPQNLITGLPLSAAAPAG